MRLLTNGAAGFPFAGENRTVRRRAYIRVQSHGFRARRPTPAARRSPARSLARLNKVDGYLYGTLLTRYHRDIVLMFFQ